MTTDKVENVANNSNTKLSGKYSIYKPTSVNNNITEQFKTVLTAEDKLQGQQFEKSFEDKIGELHPFDYEQIDGLMKRFGYVNAVVNKYTDFTIGPGFELQFDDKDKKTKDMVYKWIDETQLRSFLRPWFKEAMGKGSGYLEIADFSKTIKGNTIKTINPNTMYVKRDKYGTIEEFNQYIGNINSNRVSVTDDNNIIPLKVDDIVQLNINKFGSSAYGYGIVNPGIQTINHFLMAQDSIHVLTERKANVPIHAKMGSIEKDDYPSQADIDGLGQKLTFMNKVTEWVTGPNVEFKVIDFGNIGDKFTTILDNDYKLMSYIFEIPEVVMGSNDAGGSIGQAGKSNTQMDGFNRKILGLQDEVSIVLKNKIFDKLLMAMGKAGVKYTIVWNQLSEEENNKKMTIYKDLLGTNLSEQMRIEIEKKIALIIDIDYDIVEKQREKDKQNEMDNQQTQADDDFKKQLQLKKTAPFKRKESIDIMSPIIKPKFYANEHVCESVINENIRVNEWVNKDITNYKTSILEQLEKDTFKNLLAKNKTELSKGYLTKEEIDVLREIFWKAISENKSILDIKMAILGKLNVRDLTESNIKMPVERRIDMIAKSELTRIINTGLRSAYEKAGEWLVKWDATIDEVTCPICAELNNQVFDWENLSYDDSPPIHPNCRCSLDFIKTEESISEGWVTHLGRKIYIDDEGGSSTGKSEDDINNISPDIESYGHDDEEVVSFKKNKDGETTLNYESDKNKTIDDRMRQRKLRKYYNEKRAYSDETIEKYNSVDKINSLELQDSKFSRDKWYVTTPEDAKIFTNKDVAENIKGRGDTGCWYNSCHAAKNNENLKLYGGYVIETDTISRDISKPSVSVYSHGWNVDKEGKIVDFTLGSTGSKNLIYVGHEYDKKHFKYGNKLATAINKRFNSNNTPKWKKE